MSLGRFVLDGRLRLGWLIWGPPLFLGNRQKSICRIFGSKKKEGQTIYRFRLPCTMFGLCDENPEANPHNPIFCGVFSLDPCYELCCGRMGQIAKTTVKISSGKQLGQGLVTEASEFPTERPEGRPLG